MTIKIEIFSNDYLFIMTLWYLIQLGYFREEITLFLIKMLHGTKSNIYKPCFSTNLEVYPKEKKSA